MVMPRKNFDKVKPSKRDVLPLTDEQEKAIRDDIREATNTMDSLREQMNALSTQLFEATTYRGMTTADDFRAGHARRAKVLEDFSPVMDAYQDAKSARFRAWQKLSRSGRVA